MIENFLERLKKEFSFVGDEKISGHTALKIIGDVSKEFILPKEVEYAKQYVKDCHSDIGFMGSPEYERQKRILDSYFKPIHEKIKEEQEKLLYLTLKEKYENL